MNGARLLFLLREEVDWTKLVVVLVFFAVPIVSRILKAVFKLGGGTEEDAEASPGNLGERERRRLAREEERRSQAEGEELWRKLASGAEPAVPPRRAPAPLPTPPRTLASEEAVEPAPLAVLGAVTEPAEAAEVSLEKESEPEPLAVLAQENGLAASAESQPAPFALGRSDLRRAIVLSELLGTPVSLRGMP